MIPGSSPPLTLHTDHQHHPVQQGLLVASRQILANHPVGSNPAGHLPFTSLDISNHVLSCSLSHNQRKDTFTLTKVAKIMFKKNKKRRPSKRFRSTPDCKNDK